MSETVTVISASNPNPWERGITYYDMVFDRGGQQFACSWGTKGGEPQPGEEVTGEFSQKPDGTWKFTKGSKDKPVQREAQTGTAGGQNKRDWQPESERDPERSARILRQHSQSAAVSYAALMQSQGRLPETFGPDELKALIDWFDLDAIKAGRAALA